MLRILLLPASSVWFNYMFAKNVSFSLTERAPGDSITTYFSTTLHGQTTPYRFIDTTLDNLHHYNFVSYHLKRTLGNLGLPYQGYSYNFLKEENPVGFDPGFEDYSHYALYSGVKYYRTGNPFSRLIYVSGYKKEQLLIISHTQNIAKGWNAGVDFLRIGSEGLYQRQQTDCGDFLMHSNYVSGGNRYRALFHLYINKASWQENGGIQRDTLFEKNAEERRDAIPVNLLAAENRRYNKGMFFNQTFHFGSKARKGGDSAQTIEPHLKHHLSHTFLFSKKYFVYRDDLTIDTGFYKNVFLDTITTIDSTVLLLYRNLLQWKTEGKKLYVSGGIGHESVDVLQQNEDSLIQNIKGIFSFGKNSSPLSNWALSTQYVIEGVNKDDFFCQGTSGFKTRDSSFSLSASLTFALRSPTFFQERYVSNHFVWKNSLDKTEFINSRLFLQINRLGSAITLSSDIIKDLIFLNTDAKPEQYKGTIVQIWSAGMKNGFYFRNFFVENEITVQTGNPDSVLHLPHYVAKHALGFQNYFFKGALQARIGAEVLYFSSHYANRYMPATSVFYLQSEKKTGNYPYVDVFLNLKIKRARLFIKAEHVNAGLNGYRYYNFPNYPSPDVSFKFGIDWIMLD